MDLLVLHAAWLALSLGAMPGTASPDPVRLAVAALDAPADLRFTGKKVGEAVAAEAAGTGIFQVSGPDAVERKLGFEAGAALVRCGDDVRCLAERAAPLGVDRVVGGYLLRTATSYRVALVHVDVRAGTLVARVDRLVPIASRRLEADVTDATPAMLRGEPDGAARLTVLTDEPGVTVAIDGVTVGTTPVKRILKPGRHEVRVWGDGWARTDPAWLDLAAGADVVYRPRVYDLPARELTHRPDRTRVEVVR